MDREEATQALELLRKVVSQARDDTTLQNWGLIWMVHGVTNGAGFTATNVLMWKGYMTIWPYVALWACVLTLNFGAIFLLKSKSAGARTFIETQIWVIWLSFIGAVVLTALVNHLSGFKVFALGPIVSVLSAFGFAMMGGVMGKRWFWGAAIFGAATLAMALAPEWQFIILGGTWGIAQFAAGVLLHRAKLRRLAPGVAPAPRLV
jgi:hypothetical protein